MSDPRFAPFKQDGFNVAEFTSRVLTGSETTAQAQSEQLRDGLRILEGELSTQISNRHQVLLHHVRKLLDTENSLQGFVLSVDSLQSAVKRIRAEIAGPYDQVKTKTKQLRNLHGTVDLLRHLIHRLKLAQKLRAQLSASTSIDLAKAAKLLTDIAALDSEVDMTGVEVVAADEEFLKTAALTVREQAEAALLEGMESLSQAKVGSALQVYFNLEELHKAVNNLQSKYLHDFERSVKQALDSRHLNAGPTPVAAGGLLGASTTRSPNAVAWQDKLWQGLKDVADLMHTSTMSVWHLQRVVAKKKDPLTHVCFLDVLVGPNEPLITEGFWNQIVRILTDVMNSISKPTKGGFVRDVLISSYPKLATILEGGFEHIVVDTTMKGVLPAVGPDQLAALLGATAPFQSAYLASCLSRMTEAVAVAFPGGSRSLPGPADVQKCIALMHEELKVAGSSRQLAAMIASTVAKALALLAEKAEYMAATGPDVRQLGGAASQAQLRNIALCSQLQEVHRSLLGLLPRLPATAAAPLQSSLDLVQGGAVDVVAPIFKVVVEAIEERLLALHSLPIWHSEAAPEGGCLSTSPCVAAAAQLVVQFRSEYLTKFVPPPSPNVPSCAAALVERMAARCLTFFLRHAALIRPLTQTGKLQLAKDLSELALVVGQQLWPLEQLGPAHRALRAFRALLFQDAASVVSSPLLKELPTTTMLLHLFSRLPSSIPAPHQRSGLSPAQYSAWLDTHSFEDALRSIRSCLEASAAQVENEEAGVKATYLIMQQLCTTN